MTISSSSTHEFTIDTIVKRAYGIAGLLEASQNPKPADSLLGREFLDTILQDLETEGLFARRVRFEEVTLEEGVYVYELDAATIDVVGTGMYIAPGQTLDRASGELPVKVIARENWQLLSAKDATGTPRMVFPDRGGTSVMATFWPIPSSTEDGGTVRLPVHRLSADTLEGAKTPDAERYWTGYFMWELGHYLAISKGKGVGTASYLHSIAMKKLERCKAKSNEGVSNQMVVNHPTGWQR